MDNRDILCADLPCYLNECWGSHACKTFALGKVTIAIETDCDPSYRTPGQRCLLIAFRQRSDELSGLLRVAFLVSVS
jgi:hypothetical protein